MRLAHFAEQLDAVRRQRSRRGKAKTLSQVFKLLDNAELPAAIYLCQGRLAETYRPRQRDHIDVGQRRIASLMKQQVDHAPAKSPQVPGDDPHQSLPAEDILESLFSLYRTLHASLHDLDAWLSRHKPMPAWLVELSRRMTVQETECLSRILTGPLIKDEVIISALARFMPTSAGIEEALWKAYRYTMPDLGVVATTVLETPKAERFWTLIEMAPRPGIPLKPQEISRRDSVEDAWRAMGRCYVQPKYDGWQIQIHKKEDEVRLFDRTLAEHTSQLPDVVEACRTQIPARSAILDSEVLGYNPATGRILPCEQTLSAPAHRAFVHDVILLNGEDWRKREYFKRRQALVQLMPTNDTRILSAAPEERVDSQKNLEELREGWSAHGDSEGVVLIKPGGHYRSGRVTKEKSKLKAYLSLDLVVLGFRVSKKGVPSFFLGVWDAAGTKLIPVGWAEGAIILPDIRQELWQRCQALRAPTKPAVVANDLAPRVWVRPHIMVEVTVAGRTRDSRYQHARYSLYRKKNLRIREDLGIEDADNLQYFLTLPVPPGEQP